MISREAIKLNYRICDSINDDGIFSLERELDLEPHFDIPILNDIFKFDVGDTIYWEIQKYKF
jgi:hypothetical protein